MLPLDLALSKVPISKLSKELAYCLCTDPKDRLRHDRYHIAFNAIPLKDWSCISVIKINSFIKTFSDLAIVDFSLYYTDEFKKSNPKFLRLVLFELNQLRRI